jgi:triosephosphate isomerase
MNRQRWVIGNWKLNGNVASNAALLSACAGASGVSRLGVCVPFVYLPQAQVELEGSKVAWGSQDVSEHASGAYTGETSAVMLGEFGSSLAIVGHSERRAYHGESSELVARKAVAATRSGLRPVVCIGETLAQRESGQTEEVVLAQLAAVTARLADVPMLREMIVAYEPVWAIGTGKTASPEQAQEVHAAIRTHLRAVGLADVPVLYGGSVKASNAAAIFSQADIDGGLIGGASLVADEFLAIARANALGTN